MRKPLFVNPSESHLFSLINPQILWLQMLIIRVKETDQQSLNMESKWRAPANHMSASSVMKSWWVISLLIRLINTIMSSLIFILPSYGFMTQCPVSRFSWQLSHVMRASFSDAVMTRCHVMLTWHGGGRGNPDQFSVKSNPEIIADKETNSLRTTHHWASTPHTWHPDWRSYLTKCS